MIYIFAGGDEFLATQRLAELKAALGNPELADLNTTELPANQATAASILGQASMMPFLTERRLVVVRGYLGSLEKRLAQSKSAESSVHEELYQLLSRLEEVPDSCDLVFVEESLDKRRPVWRGVQLPKNDRHAEERKAPGLEEQVKQQRVQLEVQGTPDPKALPGWIQQRAKLKGVEIEPRAAHLLANYVGGNLRQMENELDKLAAYARGRGITAQDVNLLVSDASEAIIWDLTDALSQRNAAKAMQSLYALRRRDANAFYLLTMIANQYRTMLKVKEAMNLGLGRNEDDIAKELKAKPYPVKKAMQQASQYSFKHLEAVFNRLLESDFAMKTGADPETELDILIADLTRRK
jgi:DNA polymerase III subunit delta